MLTKVTSFTCKRAERRFIFRKYQYLARFRHNFNCRQDSEHPTDWVTANYSFQRHISLSLYFYIPNISLFVSLVLYISHLITVQAKSLMFSKVMNSRLKYTFKFSIFPGSTENWLIVYSTQIYIPMCCMYICVHHGHTLHTYLLILNII